MLASMKLLSLDLWPAQVTAIDNLRINITLKMLKSPHFNAKMNALKEVSLVYLHMSANINQIFYTFLIIKFGQICYTF